MPLNASGTISLGGSVTGQSINLELNQAASATISLNDTAVRSLAAIPSGSISLSSFWGKSNAKYYIGFGQSSSPWINMYRWTDTGGFGTKYANPGTLMPSGNAPITAFHPSGSAIYLTGGSPYLHAYGWSDSGFGTKFTNPTGVTTTTYSVAINPAGTALVFGYFASPFVGAIRVTNTSFGTIYSNPSSLPPNAVYSAIFSATGGAVLCTHGSPFISAYAWTDASGFGTKYATPSTPARASTGATTWQMNPQGGSFLMMNSNYSVANGPGDITVEGYAWSDATGFGARYATLNLYNSWGGGSLCYTNAGDAVIFGYWQSPYLSAHRWSNSTGIGTKFTNPSVAPQNTVSGSGMSFSDKVVFCGLSASPWIAAYAWDSTTGFGVRYANPATLPAGAANGRALVGKL